MAAGERWISKPRRVLYTAILIPLLGALGCAGAQTTGPESDVGMVAAMAVGRMQPKLVLSTAGPSDRRQAARGLEPPRGEVDPPARFRRKG